MQENRQFIIKIKVVDNKAVIADADSELEFTAFCKEFYQESKSNIKFKQFVKNSKEGLFFQDSYPARSQLNVAGTNISLVMERVDL